jgi:chemotaxis protein CheX
MKKQYIDTIAQAAYDVFEEALGTDISRRKSTRYLTAFPLHRISVMAGVAGELEGYVLLSMPLDVVLSLTAVITNDEVKALDDVAQAAIIGLVDTIMQEALRRFRDKNIQVTVSPAALFWGQGVQLSCTELETVAIPLQMPLGTVELSVALRAVEDSG